MAKFCGYIGFAISGESTDPDRPDVWINAVTKRRYMGDVIRDYRKMDVGDRVIENLDIANTFSVIADSFAKQNLGRMVYIEYMGIRWAIRSVEPAYPRLNITVGGVYNGPQAS